ncbi:hypothetical protein HU200_059213 [Digitaria exilis]|uniref:Uncharacterized protein n=1 Tax=Digitaria exilis TaxID=1010633 RepID=A0A835DYR6_9POAL|nr:hypothetical protein HU200_059213 [Digitaria exilis]
MRARAREQNAPQAGAGGFKSTPASSSSPIAFSVKPSKKRYRPSIREAINRSSMTKQSSAAGAAAVVVGEPVVEEKAAVGVHGVEATTTEQQGKAIISMAKRAVEEEAAKAKIRGAAAAGELSLKRSFESFLEGRRKKATSYAASCRRRRRLESSSTSSSSSSSNYKLKRTCARARQPRGRQHTPRLSLRLASPSLHPFFILSQASLYLFISEIQFREEESTKSDAAAAAAGVGEPVVEEKAAVGVHGVEATTTEQQGKAIISMAKRAVEEEAAKAKSRGDGAAAAGEPSLKRSLECFLEGRKKKSTSSAAKPLHLLFLIVI